MRFRPFLALALFLGVEAQNTGSSAGNDSGGSGAGSSVNEATTPTAGGRATTTNPPPTSSAPSTPTSPSSNGGGGNSNTGGSDVTVTRTTTVTGAGEGTVTVGTTAFATVTATVVVVMTKFETTTVTEDAETSTKVVYVTSTQWANQKRAINMAPRTDGPEHFVVEAIPTDAPVVDVDANVFELIRHRRGNLFKRATITEFVTVTVGSGAGRTVTNAVTQTVTSTVSEETTTTSLVTSTEAANAKTTVTVTSTLLITSTLVTTGVVQTATVAPTGGSGSDGNGGSSSGGNKDSSSSGGLSTGAKAGIGAGCGVAALLVIGGIIWFCVKKRRDKRNKFDSDDMFGSSEVPVGPAQPAMASQHDRDVAAGIISPRPMPPKPSSPEGYRGTAPGDGRSGFAKPDAYGAAAYTPASPETMYSRTASAKGGHPDIPEMQSPANTAELANDGGTAKWHETNAAEIDGNQVTSTTGTAPPPHVYEMPAQNYK